MTCIQDTSDVKEKHIESILIAGVRMRGQYSDMGKGFGLIARHFALNLAGQAMGLYYDKIFRENADFEACIPIKKSKEVEGISVRELVGGKCIYLIHKGPYDELGASYGKIMMYAHKKKYKLTIPTREIYLKGPGMIFKGNPQKYLTEIQIIIE